MLASDGREYPPPMVMTSGTPRLWPHRYYSPCLRMPFALTKRGRKNRWMTWQTLFGRPYPRVMHWLYTMWFRFNMPARVMPSRPKLSSFNASTPA